MGIYFSITADGHQQSCRLLIHIQYMDMDYFQIQRTKEQAFELEHEILQLSCCQEATV